MPPQGWGALEKGGDKHRSGLMLACAWIRPIPASCSVSQPTSSQDSPSYATEPPTHGQPLFPGRCLGCPVVGLCQARGTPSPPQCSPAGGRDSKDHGHPKSSLLHLSRCRGTPQSSPPLPVPRTAPAPPALPGGLGAPLRTMKPSGTARLPPPAAPRRPRRPVAPLPPNLPWEGAHLGVPRAGGTRGCPRG